MGVYGGYDSIEMVTLSYCMYLLDAIKMVTNMLFRGVNRSRSWISARASCWNTREWLLSTITDYEVDNGVT